MNTSRNTKMTEAIKFTPFPRGALIGAACLMTSAIVSAVLARNYDIGATRYTPAAVTQSRDLLFTDTANGAVRVEDAVTGHEVDVLDPGISGFVRVVLRGLARERMIAGATNEAPFRLSRLADGRTLLEDRATGQVVGLNAFGSDNAKAFAPLFEKGR
jgi:putative photosynthetic complex assembly protein